MEAVDDVHVSPGRRLKVGPFQDLAEIWFLGLESSCGRK